jgi:hypothetical protein
LSSLFSASEKSSILLGEKKTLVPLLLRVLTFVQDEREDVRRSRPFWSRMTFLHMQSMPFIGR